MRTKHDGDCPFYSLSKVCTCGYLHYWLPRMEEAPAEVHEHMEAHESGLGYLEQRRHELDAEREAWIKSPDFEKARRELFKSLGAEEQD